MWDVGTGGHVAPVPRDRQRGAVEAGAHLVHDHRDETKLSRAVVEQRRGDIATAIRSVTDRAVLREHAFRPHDVEGP